MLDILFLLINIISHVEKQHLGKANNICNEINKLNIKVTLS